MVSLLMFRPVSKQIPKSSVTAAHVASHKQDIRGFDVVVGVRKV